MGVTHKIISRVRYTLSKSHLFKEAVCRLTHRIEDLDKSFTDVVTGRPVNMYKCNKCGSTYMAYHKRAIFRVYIIHPNYNQKA